MLNKLVVLAVAVMVLANKALLIYKQQQELQIQAVVVVVDLLIL
jgi:hypothetical protein